jgi:hypothetical protein
VLFDVDGTLFLTHDEVYVEAARAAMREVYSTDAEGPDVPGDTATAHVRRALHAAGFGQAEIEAGLGDWCRSFSNRYVRLLAESDTSHWQLAPHAAEAVSAVERHALLTGNPQAVAHARMERLGLAALFPPGQGAFGCERESRTALFELARSEPAIGRWSEPSRSATLRSTSRPRMTRAASVLASRPERTPRRSSATPTRLSPISQGSSPRSQRLRPDVTGMISLR